MYAEPSLSQSDTTGVRDFAWLHPGEVGRPSTALGLLGALRVLIQRRDLGDPGDKGTPRCS